MNVLILIEHDNLTLKSSNLSVISAALQLGDTIDLLIVGYQCHNVAKEAQAIEKVNKIMLIDEATYAHFLAETGSPLLAHFAKNYDYVLAPANTFGKNILPRTAALLNLSMVSDVIKIVAKDTFVRPIYAGNALATVKSHDTLKIISVRTSAFLPVKTNENQKTPIEALVFSIVNSQSYFCHQELTVSKRPELDSARVVVAGGRGLKSVDNFKLLEKIADKLGAALGASRAAVDAGFAPNDYQVGQTGKIIAPDLYIAVGISGAIQHVAGMKGSKVIVAINSDPDAPIFQIADYRFVGDLFKILPELEEALSQ